MTIKQYKKLCKKQTKKNYEQDHIRKKRVINNIIDNAKIRIENEKKENEKYTILN
jgi:hypothetical protein